MVFRNFFYLVGRCFDGHILDMIELGIDRYISMQDIKVRRWLTVEKINMEACPWDKFAYKFKEYARLSEKCP